MLSAVVLDTLSDEEISISRVLQKAYRQRELPIKMLEVVSDLTALRQNAKEYAEKCNVFIASFRRNVSEYVDFAQLLRHERKDIFIVFIVNRETDITYCVRPSVRPAGILFIPLNEIQVYQTIREIYVEYMQNISRSEQSAFVIKTAGEYFNIDTEEISFFEARGKKIAVKTRAQEIQFYSNFETILEQLPDSFMRCHRGFVVNTFQIQHANFNEMTLTLKDKCKIPISRSYRDAVRNVLEEKGVSL